MKQSFSMLIPIYYKEKVDRFRKAIENLECLYFYCSETKITFLKY